MISKKNLSGTITGLFSTPDPENFVTASRQSLEFALGGIPGDRHFGHERLSGGREKKEYPRNTPIHNNRQWSAVSTEEIEGIAEKMQLDRILPEWMGANLMISGIADLSHLPPLSKLRIFRNNELIAVLAVYGQNRPCIHPHRAMEAAVGKELKVPFTIAAADTRGLVGWVEKAGIVNIGDKIEII